MIQRTLTGCAFFEDSRGRRRVPAGWAMLFAYGEESRYGTEATSDEPLSLDYLNLVPSASLRPLFEGVRAAFGAVLRMPTGGGADRLFDELRRRSGERSFRDAWHESELVCRFFHALHREQTCGPEGETGIERGHREIQHRFRSAMNLKTLAAECGVSREHFAREFARRYGEAPGRMLRRLRLEHARELLAETKRQVQEVALDSGFLSGNSFCKAYRREFGCSPREEMRPALTDAPPLDSGPRRARVYRAG